MPIPPEVLQELRDELERELARLERSLVLGAEAAEPVALYA